MTRPRYEPARLRPGSVVLLVAPPIAATFAWNALPPWQFMVLLAASMWLGCKTWSFWTSPYRSTAGLGRSLGYLLLWPGMHADAFLDRTRRPEAPRTSQWASAMACVLSGCALLAAGAELVSRGLPLRGAWLGVAGLLFALHFGLFQHVALALRSAGVDAVPIMDAPFRATSLSDFWGRRWNVAYHDLAMQLVFAPLARRLGPTRAVALTFLASGLVHDFAISFPARGGYGLPTLYFAIQGAGALLERRVARPSRGSTTAARRAVTLAVVLLPAPLLFHPPFARHVIAPLLTALAGR